MSDVNNSGTAQRITTANLTTPSPMSVAGWSIGGTNGSSNTTWNDPVLNTTYPTLTGY